MHCYNLKQGYKTTHAYASSSVLHIKENYRRAKQHITPVLPKNQHAPRNRNMATTAFDHSRAWKKRAVRSVESFYRVSQKTVWKESKGRGERGRTVNPNLSTPSLVMQTATNALLKIQNVTSRVRKLLYESSIDFSSCSTGATYGVNARLTVASN